MKFKVWMQGCEVINTFTNVLAYKHYKGIKIYLIENLTKN